MLAKVTSCTVSNTSSISSVMAMSQVVLIRLA